MLEGMRKARQIKNYKAKEEEYAYIRNMLRTIDVELVTTFDEFIGPGRRRTKKVRLRNLENNLQYTRNVEALVDSLKRIEEKQKKDRARQKELGLHLPIGNHNIKAGS